MTRKRRKWLWFAALLLACAAAFYGWAIYHGGKQLREAMAEAAAGDPHWQIRDIEAHRRPIDDKDNSSLVIAAGYSVYVRPQGPNKELEWEELIGDLSEFPAARLNGQQSEALANVLKGYSASLVEYRKLKDMPWGRPPIKITEDIVGTLLPFSQNARHAAQALRLDAFDRMEANDSSGAANAVLAGFNASRSLGDEPFLISALVRIAIDHIVLFDCERLLAQLELDDPTLSRLQAAIELQMNDPNWQLALRGERAFGFAYLQYLKENPGKAQGMSDFVGGTNNPYREWLAFLPGYISRGQAELLRLMNEAVAIARRPIEDQREPLEEWDRKAKTLSFFAQQVSPSVLRVYQAELRHQALLRTMLLAVAAERYRVQHKQWPDKLDDLISAKLIDKLPLDPFDGQPLRWKVTEEGRVIYSVGKDRTDDGGVDLKLKFSNNGDVGFRLYDLAKRRQAPRPVKPAEAETEPPG